MKIELKMFTEEQDESAVMQKLSEITKFVRDRGFKPVEIKIKNKKQDKKEGKEEEDEEQE